MLLESRGMPGRREPDDGNFTWAGRAVRVRTVPGTYQPVARASMNPAWESAAGPTYYCRAQAPSRIINHLTMQMPTGQRSAPSRPILY